MKKLKKAKTEKGFTLVEMLCVVLIITLVTGLMITCVNLASKTMQQTVDTSNSQVLCATLETAVRNKIQYANPIKRGTSGEVLMGSSEEQLDVVDNYVVYGNKTLLGKKSYPENCKVDLSVRWLDNADIVSVSITISDSNDAVLAQTSFQVKPLNV